MASAACPKEMGEEMVGFVATPVGCCRLLNRPDTAFGARRGCERRQGAVGVFMMAAGKRKKARGKVGGGDDDSENAVDVFGAVGMSQEELLAAALAVDAPSNARNKNGAVISSEEDEEQENVGGVLDEAGAAHDSTVPETLIHPSASDGKKKKKGGKKSIPKGAVEDENSVDVFGGVGKSQEELLAEALADSPPPPMGKKKKKKGFKATDPSDEEEEGNAVDVFGAIGKTQEELLASAGLTSPAGTTVDADETLATQDDAQDTRKSKKKGKKNKSSEGNVVDVFGGHGKSQDELMAEALGTSSPGPREASFEISSDVSSEWDQEVDPSGDPGGDENAPEIPDALEEEYVNDVDDEFQSEAYKKELEGFEADADVTSEFDLLAEEMEDFTFSGRRKKSLSKAAAQKQATYGSGGEDFTSIRLQDVGMMFRGEEVLKSVTWEVKTGDRIGLVGANGCGKTTQLKIIAGSVEPTKGEVIRSSKQTKASFLKQEFVDELTMANTLRQEFRKAFATENELVSRYEQTQSLIESAGDDMEKLETLLNELEDLRVKCEASHAWDLDSRIDKIMPGLGFNEEDNEKLVGSFSGGWKVRIGIGKVLLSDPDVLLLDEPTNHLDLDSVEWIEGYLSNCKLPMVIVSHDREFMDKLCTTIVEIENGEAFEYKGNYSNFISSKKLRREAWEAAFEKQKKFLDEQRQFIRRFRSSATRASQVKSREKMILRLEQSGDLVRKPPRPGKPLVFRFPQAPRSGRDVVLLEGITHAYGEKVLFDDAGIAIERGDKIAILGPNGCGKSTLLRFIMKKESPQEGTVESLENHNVVAGYFEQNQADALDLERTVMEIAREAAPVDMSYEEIRALLGKFLFKGDSVDKKVRALSGGEKARLALCKMMMTPANLLVLDEPTNHLDIPAKEMLEEALQAYDGTLIVVSHDRYFVSQVATQIVAVEDHQLELYDGDYKYYIEKHDEILSRLKERSIAGLTSIKSAPKVDAEAAQEVAKTSKRKKNFGGSGVSSGKSNVMNAKRWTNL